MRVSIITATFNSGSTIGDTLQSILSQSYSDYEVIIKDGGSKDDTQRVVKEFEPKFNGRLRWISQNDEGIYDAMNQGIALSHGDIVGILNSDDFYADENVLRDVVEAFDDSDVDCVYGDLLFVDHDITSKIIRTWTGSQYSMGCFQRGWHPAHPTFYAKRKLFQRFGSFDTSFDVSADFELMLRFLEKHRCSSKYINRVFVKMRLGGESTGSLSKIIIGNKNIIRAFKKNGIPVSRLYTVKRLVPKAVNMLKTKFGL